MKKLIVLVIQIIVGCSDTALVENWRNPDIVLFDAETSLYGICEGKERAIIWRAALI